MTPRPIASPVTPAAADLRLSVVIPTRNPHPERLGAVLAGLAAQTLPSEKWELILVDNGSSTPPSLGVLAGQPGARIIVEPRPGTLWARLAGLRAARAPVILCIDDDAVPFPESARAVLDYMAAHPDVATAGGRIHPGFESPPLDWVEEVSWALALREWGDTPLQWNIADGGPLPSWTAVGAGLVVRRDALPAYYRHVETSAEQILRRSWRGQGIGSLEDKDLVLCLIRAGWSTGYCPELRQTHLIPARRLQAGYFADLLPALQEMWMRTLHAYGLDDRPPISPWSVAPRKLKAWFKLRAYSGPAGYLAWRAACGSFNGLAANYNDPFRYPIH
ncbi:MAG: family 2 glycosyl transferase [Rariglobus sp.]|jgi:glycosyltransferase involved in cell wall biosynthesis|nr:family 2 glycosyl transferase [Rariglobus sp.]